MTSDERALCAVTARWLAASGRTAATLGLGAAAAALVLLCLRASPSLWALAVLLALPLERWLALRVRFDAGLFTDLAAGRITLTALDDALATLRLRRAGPVTRPLDERVAGARRLALQQVMLALLQFAALVPAWWIGGLGR